MRECKPSCVEDLQRDPTQIEHPKKKPSEYGCVSSLDCTHIIVWTHEFKNQVHVSSAVAPACGECSLEVRLLALLCSPHGFFGKSES